MSLQGPHQSAQKSTTTAFPRSLAEAFSWSHSRLVDADLILLDIAMGMVAPADEGHVKSLLPVTLALLGVACAPSLAYCATCSVVQSNLDRPTHGLAL